VKVDGAKLAAARERVFNSQDELAESISMNPVIVMRLETADRTEIRDKTWASWSGGPNGSSAPYCIQEFRTWT
jgi:hypothetical protein